MFVLSGIARHSTVRGLVSSRCLQPVRDVFCSQQYVSVVRVGGARQISLKASRDASSLWIREKVAQSRKYLDQNPMVKISMIGAGVILSVLIVVDWLVRTGKKAGPQPVILLPAKVGGYVELRQDDIGRLKDLCSSMSRGVNILHLCGPELCGKTQLLLQFADDWLEQRSRGLGRWMNSKAPVVICLDAKDSAQLLVQLHGAAHSLGCDVSDISAEGRDQFLALSFEEQVRDLCHAVGSKLKARRGWLLALDGDGCDVMRKWLPDDGSRDWGSGTVIVSSQQSSKQSKTVNLGKG